ncbi:thioesterase domain-containing protein [Bradyrhizobium elkanii]|jgi:thioesterase domain-containing protein|uniref:thioesterase domain-containing protein n=2 Tax=Bradyrhizobium elkanii TaxID=29448 RepID=UPI002169A6D5|nr:alpha/beta fold hydrolase [Bradyrhizobium elkanii]MCS3520930.1 thioesterase domain-containing protein [Bradyrhizobium elkanii]MCS4068587.1 thioesterase domain-containing protein [Bradyrhizobium elkanii]MCS4084121.1 thioesterase domain-containing protein [Bradyrhizobium elkanii]MCS4104628.1 thioesterase domain-containing protein [Bradyrhizobium elkanii]MCW2126212.1 thioesterase domain-containing protein [Bradyrhizobium elkanii]
MSASSMKSPMSAQVMQFSELLADLAVKDIKVWVEGDRLRCNAPAGALTAELRDQLQGRRGEIIAFLNMATAATTQPPAIVPLQSRGTRTPIYAVPGHVGAPSSFLDLSKNLGGDQPFYALQPPGFDGQSEPMDRVEDIAEYFARQIVEYQPTGPYIIAGYCSGASTAFELAQILGQRKSEVACVALFGPLHPTTYGEWPRRLYFVARAKAESFLHATAKLPTFSARLRYFGSRLREHFHALVRGSKEPVATDPVLASRALLKSTAIAAFQRYTPTPYSGRVCIILPNKAWLRSGAAPHRWLRVVPHAEFYFGPDDCNEASMLMEPDAPAIADLYRQATQKQND